MVVREKVRQSKEHLGLNGKQSQLESSPISPTPDSISSSFKPPLHCCNNSLPGLFSSISSLPLPTHNNGVLTQEGHSFLLPTEPGPHDVITKEFYRQLNYSGSRTYSPPTMNSWPQDRKSHAFSYIWILASTVHQQCPSPYFLVLKSHLLLKT